MTREEAKEFILFQEPIFLQPANRISGKQSYVCPVCGSGSHKNKTGIIVDPRSKGHPHYSCFPCKANGTGYYDIIDLYAFTYGLDPNSAETFDSIYNYYRIDIDNKGIEAPRSENKPPVNQIAINPQEEPQNDYTSYFKRCKANNNYTYLLSRGISKEIQDRFFIGFDNEWTHPKAPTAPKSPRCIIPISKYTYLARDTREEVPQEAQGYIKSKVGHNAPPFNLQALNSKSPVIFLTEGEIDALSVEEVGFTACGLGGAYKAQSFIDTLEANYKGQAFVILADNDENGTGDRARETLEEGFKNQGIPYIIGELKAHDPNEALINDREGFTDALRSLQEEAKGLLQLQNKNEYSALDILDHFKNIENEAPGFEVSTGFENLDHNLNGGLHEGLIIIGAVSSLGKTTFTLQLADQVARKGVDVLFFSLEMSKHELIAKSLSRFTFKENGRDKTPQGEYIAKDTAQIMNGRRYKYYTAVEKTAINKAICDYEASTAPNIYIYEGRYQGQRLNVGNIRDIVKNHITKTGNTPVVIVDYLQILAPLDPRQTDKQATDEAVFCLKEISRDYKAPVIAISSFNRDNYNNPVSMQSFKESGAVEYSSDILLGLQFKGMDYTPGESEKDRAKRLQELQAQIYSLKRDKEPIEIELKCLKNRNGYQFTTGFNMVSAFNCFVEAEPNKEGFTPFIGNNPFEGLKR